MQHHGAGLRRLLEAKKVPSAAIGSLVITLATDPRSGRIEGVELEERDLVMLDYVEKLTSTPGEMNADDVRGLRGVGFDDRAVHDICAIAAYYAFVNRIAAELGVELEG